MNKFFHDNEKFISEIKRKYGSTNLDKYYEEYLENKKKTKPRGYGNQKPNQINNLNELNEMFVANCIKDFPNNIFNLNVPINYMLMNQLSGNIFNVDGIPNMPHNQLLQAETDKPHVALPVQQKADTIPNKEEHPSSSLPEKKPIKEERPRDPRLKNKK